MLGSPSREMTLQMSAARAQRIRKLRRMGVSKAFTAVACGLERHPEDRGLRSHGVFWTERTGGGHVVRRKEAVPSAIGKVMGRAFMASHPILDG